MTSRFALLLILIHVAVPGCSNSQPGADQSDDASSTVESAALPEQSGPFETYFAHRPFLLSGRTIGLATPFAVRVTESRYDLAFSQFEQKSPTGTPESVAARALQLMLDDDADGLVQMASEDSHEGNVKFYAALGKQFEGEPTASFRLNLHDHSCVCFVTGNEKVPGVAIPLKRRGEEYELFVTDQSTSLQQFVFKVVGDIVQYPEAAAAIPESTIQTRFKYRHPDTSEDIDVFVTNFAGVGEDGELILPADFAGNRKRLNDILTLQSEFWETFDSQGLEAAGEMVHPDLKLFFVKRAEKRVAEGHHPYDSHHDPNQKPEYSLKVKWIAWTDDVWTLGVDVTKKATPESDPEIWTVIERYVLDPEIGEPRYWTVTADNLFNVMTDEAVQQQVDAYIQTLQ